MQKANVGPRFSAPLYDLTTSLDTLVEPLFHRKLVSNAALGLS
jgi:hypothetical protein